MNDDMMTMDTIAWAGGKDLSQNSFLFIGAQLGGACDDDGRIARYF